MFINQVKEAIDYLFQANITPLIWGFHGIGKTDVISQYAGEKKYKFFNLRVGQMGDAGDLLGLGELKKDNKTGETVSTKFFIPNWLHEITSYCKDNPESGGIIFLDEINRAARKDILQAVFELCLDKKLHECVLPKNCYVIAAANPDTEDYNVINFDDKAFNSRFCHISLTPSKKEWIEYAKKTEHDKEVVDFILEQPELLDTDLKSFSIEDVVKPCRRSWTSVSRLRKIDVPNELLKPLMQGLVGLNATTAFFKFLDRDDKPIEAEELLKHYVDKYQERVKKLSDPAKCRQDIITNILTKLEDHFEKREKKLTKKEQGNFLQFLKDIPADQMFSTLQKLYLKEPCRELLENDNDILNIAAKAKGVEPATL